jgi:hypothetical protein
MQFLNWWLLIPTLLCMHFFKEALVVHVSGPYQALAPYKAEKAVTSLARAR